MIKNLRRHLFLGGGGFVFGVLVFSLWPQLNFYFVSFVYLLSLVVIFLSILKYRKVKLIFSLLVVILLGFVLGFLRVDIFEAGLKEGQNFILGTKVSIQAQIVKEPDVRDSSTRLVVRVPEAKFNILIVTDVYQKFNLGDVVQVEGVISLPVNFVNEDTGREFDYVNFLKKEKIIYQISFATVEKINTEPNLGQVMGLQKFLFTIKNNFNSKLSLLIKEPANSLLAGILTGDRRGLGTEWENKFRQAGLIHIVVLSGFNITIVAVVVVSLLTYVLDKKTALVCSLIAIFLFALAVGAGPAVIRASLMAGIAILARLSGRTYLAGVGLGVAGFLMVLWNPMVLVFDPSFQLSFLATAGLVYLAPVIENRIYFLNFLPDWFKEIVVTTTSAQVAVWPWLGFFIGELSAVALVVNILVLPVVPAVMLLGFIAGLIAWGSQILAIIPATLAYFLLYYILEVARLFADFTFSTIVIPRFNFFGVIVCYLFLLMLIVKYRSDGFRLDINK